MTKKKNQQIYCAKCEMLEKKTIATCVIIVDGIESPVCDTCKEDSEKELLDLLSKEFD